MRRDDEPTPPSPKDRSSIEIPAKKESAKLVVRTFADGLIAPETITLTITPTATYAPSVFDEVTATIINKNR